jgi:hypothetical protein
MPPANEDEETCPENAAMELRTWFPNTPPVQSCFPKPHPFTECPFYMNGFQHFLIATQPAANGEPAFLNWNTIENTFGADAGKPHPEGPPILTSGVTQAGPAADPGRRQPEPRLLRHHFNKAFVDFVNKYQLTSVDGIKKAPAQLAVPQGRGRAEVRLAGRSPGADAQPADDPGDGARADAEDRRTAPSTRTTAACGR